MTTSDDSWETYPVRFVDDAIGSIVYNHGISETINSLPIDQFVSFSLQVKNPDENGFAGMDEIMVINAIGNQLLSFTDQHAGLFAGQLSLEGKCHFYTYNDATEETIEALIQKIQHDYGYLLESSVQKDAEKRRYWDDLFPDPICWQLMRDTKVAAGLEEIGDDLSLPRRIDHFASFDSDSSLDAFSRWASEQGFHEEARSVIVGDDDDEVEQYRIQISRTDAPHLATIHPITRAICNKCLQLGGSYDGWKASPPPLV